MEYDVFICHASEDKGFIEPLAQALSDKGLKVWYDRFELKIGDSLRQKIDYGLANSKYGIVVLSKVFFDKGWPQSELDALESRQNREGRKVILPVWHEIEAEEVHKRSPLLGSLLAARSCDGIDFVANQIIDVCSEKGEPTKRSVFQISGKLGLRERCLDVIRNGEPNEWPKLVDELQSPIADALIKWKTSAEAKIHEDPKKWKEVVMEAVNICLSGFVPLFAAVETGRKDRWEYAVRILHRLALLEGKMGGGLTDVLRIGWDMLYLPGNIGMAIAVETDQQGFVFDWMRLSMPGYRFDTEIRWADIRAAFWPPIGIAYKEPFRYLLDLYESEYIHGFFPSKEKMQEYLFKANLIQSIVEMRFLTETKDGIAIVESSDSKYKSDIKVAPWWCMIKSDEFTTWSWELFGSSDGFIKFFTMGGKGNVSPEKIWSWWKGWKEICKECIYAITHGNAWVHNEWLMLPGEPHK
jgi:hypothetical protein